MSTTGKHRTQAQFGATADQYASSALHARGDSLRLLRDAVACRPDWTALDVACGAGHTAFTVAPSVARVIAVDLTPAMTRTTAALAAERQLRNIQVVTADAEALPVQTGAVQLVTCRLAFHHFPDPNAAVAEWKRVLSPEGILVLADNVTVDDPEAADYYNAYERRRDPSHHCVYSLAQLCRLLTAAHLHIEMARTFSKELEFEEWADRQHVTRADRQILQEMMRALPTPLTPLFAPRWADGTMYFSLWEAVLVARCTAPAPSGR